MRVRSRSDAAGVIALTLCLASALPAGAGDTATFRANDARTGVYASSGSHFGGVLWRTQTGGAVRSSPVVADGTLFVGSSDGVLYALDASTGAQRWRFAAGSAIDATPALAHGIVYVGTRAGTMYALDAATGRVRWSLARPEPAPLEFVHDLFQHWTSSVVISSGLAIFGNVDGYLYAVDAASGAQRWRVRTGGRIVASPTVAGATVFAGSFDGKMYAVDVRRGTVRWTYATRASTQHSRACGYDCRSIRSSAVVGNGLVVFGARDGLLYALDAGRGTLRWSLDHRRSWVDVSPALRDDVVYAGTADSHLVEAVSLRTGRPLWHVHTAGLVLASPALAGDTLYAADFTGRLYAYDARRGTLRWSYRFTDAGISSSPALEGGALYYGSDDGSVSALRLGTRATLQRAVFYDRAYARLASFTAAATGRSSEDVRTYFAARGYRVLDLAALRAFFVARTADRAPSVVVFAIDYLPSALGPAARAPGVARRYLDAGGKIVWLGFPPLLWTRDARTGAQRSIDPSATKRFIGVDYGRGGFEDPLGASITSAGKRWGLRGPLLTMAQAAPASVTTVLASDEDGMAGAWVRRFGGPPGTGFVLLPPFGFDLVPDANPNVTLGSVQQAAEFFPLR